MLSSWPIIGLLGPLRVFLFLSVMMFYERFVALIGPFHGVSRVFHRPLAADGGR